jgi:hypothetical protein
VRGSGIAPKEDTELGSHPRITLPALLALAVGLGGCSTAKRPVLYPNSHYETVGQVAAETDIDDCMSLAQQAGASGNPGDDMAKQTAAGAAIGAAGAGAWGLVRGDAGERALAGAAAGGATGLTRSAIQSSEPDPIFRNFVQHCLSERGYDVIGWR